MLHLSKQPAWQRPLVRSLQQALRTTPLGAWFFAQVATPTGVKNVLQQCYGDPAAVDDELVGNILRPGLQPGVSWAGSGRRGARAPVEGRLEGQQRGPRGRAGKAC